MSFWRYIRLIVRAAWRDAEHTGHRLHLYGALIIGALLSIWPGIKFEEPMIPVVTLMAVLFVFILGLFYQSYSIYLEEYKKREFSDNTLTPIKSPQDLVAFFTGHWRIISDVKPPHPEQVFDLKPSFEATGGPKGSTPNNGTWSMVDGEARIEWTNTGWKDSLRRESHVVRKFAREPGISWDGPIHNTAIAVKIG